jgi:amino-acid N-acetyltransferase
VPDPNFVAWFRSVAPYINSFRGKTFVIAVGGKAISGPLAKTFAYDINLLASLGIRLVVVHGARPQIEEELRDRGLPSVFHGNYRVTDADTLDCVLHAVGSVYLEIEALLSQGLPNTPMAGSTIRVVAGNFLTARPMGVIDGVDMQYAGIVRKVDADGMRAQHSLGNIVLQSCEGASPSGEIFNLAMEEVAEAVAVALRADKLIYIGDTAGALEADGSLIEELTTEGADKLLKRADWLSPDMRRFLPCSIRACRAGVGRVHLVGYNDDGSMILELFTHDGVGTIITRDSLDRLRDARPDDIAGLLGIIEPLEQDGTLVPRPRERIEQEVSQFTVLEHDNVIVGCAALYLLDTENAELACLAVDNEHREWGYGERLMQAIEARARAQSIRRLYVLTTRTAHWFIERGYKPAKVEDLPDRKREMYNYQRNSKVFVKNL